MNATASAACPAPPIRPSTNSSSFTALLRRSLGTRSGSSGNGGRRTSSNVESALATRQGSSNGVASALPQQSSPRSFFRSSITSSSNSHGATKASSSKSSSKRKSAANTSSSTMTTVDSVDDSAAVSTASSSRRQSMRRSLSAKFSITSSSSESSAQKYTYVVTEDMARVELALQTRKAALIKSLISLDGDFGVRVRFMDTVDQYLQEEDANKQRAMGGKIVTIFFPPGPANGQNQNEEDDGLPAGLATLFGIQSCVHEHTLRRLLRAQYHPYLVQARNQVLHGLGQSILVLDAVDRVLNEQKQQQQSLSL